MAIQSQSRDSRKVKNVAAQWLISIGGISVLFVLVLIFLYLLYVIKPIFEGASVDTNVIITNENRAGVLSVGVNEQQEIAYQIDNRGDIYFYQLINGPSIHYFRITISYLQS